MQMMVFSFKVRAETEFATLILDLFERNFAFCKMHVMINNQVKFLIVNYCINMINSHKKILISIFIVVLLAVGICWYFKLTSIQEIDPVKIEDTDNIELKGATSILEVDLDSSTSLSKDELISPDGEWYFAGEKYFGKEPFSRALSRYLEFINLKEKGNRYIYEDWFERPEDGSYSSTFRTAHPIGWSADGTSVYMAYTNLLKEEDLSLPRQLGGYWANPTNVVKINLSFEMDYSDFQDVGPYLYVNEGSKNKGHILDLLPKEDRALWFGSNSSSTELVYFSPSNNSNSHVILKLDEHDKSVITSASLDRDPEVERAAYIVHRQGKNDEAYVYTNVTSTTTSTVFLDLKPYHKDIFAHGITEPYKLIVEKTSMFLPRGLFLVVVGANNEIMFVRFNDFGKGYESLLSKSGLL